MLHWNLNLRNMETLGGIGIPTCLAIGSGISLVVYRYIKYGFAIGV